MHKICFTISFISCLYMFRTHVLIIRRSKLHYTASGIITPIGVFLFSPSWLFDPVWCRNSRWINTIAAIANGIRKCNAKNRVSVVLSTANPPHTHWTTSFPTYGIADRRFVITVAPQNDICPHCSTYPMNAVAMVRNRITILLTTCAWSSCDDTRGCEYSFDLLMMSTCARNM